MADPRGRRVAAALAPGLALLPALLLAALACALPSDGFRAWRKGAFGDGPGQTVEFYAVFVLLPVWAPVLALAAALRRRPLAPKPAEHVMFRRWLPSVTPLEAAAYALVLACSLVWIAAKVRRGWGGSTERLAASFAEALGLGTVPLLAGLLLPTQATEAAMAFLASSPERAVALHKWMGAGAVLLMAAHGLMYLALFAVRGGWEAIQVMVLSGASCHGTHVCIPAGLGAGLAGVIFAFFARYAQRRLNWRRFRVFHVLGAPLFYLGSVAHWAKFTWYLAPVLALYMTKVAARLHQRCYRVHCLVAVSGADGDAGLNGVGAEKADPGGKVVVHLALPQLPGHRFAGQWAGVGTTGWAAENHPCTLVSAPGQPRAEVLLALNRKSALARAAVEARRLHGRPEGGRVWAPLDLRVLGPHGGTAPLEAVPTLLVAGGSGITSILALTNHEAHLASRGRRSEGRAPRRVVWTVRGTAVGRGLYAAAAPHLAGLEHLAVHDTVGRGPGVAAEFLHAAGGEPGPPVELGGALGATCTFRRLLGAPPLGLPPPAEVDPLWPVAAACVGGLLGAATLPYLQAALVPAEQGWLAGPLALLAVAGLALALALAVTLLLASGRGTRRHGAAGGKRPTAEETASFLDLGDREAFPAAASLRDMLPTPDRAAVAMDVAPSHGGDGRAAVQTNARGHTLARGRPDFAVELAGLVEAAPPGARRLDVVVSGPPALVRAVRAACADAGHPLRRRLRLREAAFEL